MQEKEYRTEWSLLQNQFDSYEKHSLYIKLVSVILFFLSEVFDVKTIVIVLIFMLLWLQDAIWKTFQSRLEPRLFQIEKYIRDKASEYAYQFNSEYQKNSLNGAALFGEYARQAI